MFDHVSNTSDLPLVIFTVIVGGIIYLFNRSVENHQHWQHSFDGLQFSAEEFYKSVQESITKREIPGIRFSRVTYSQAGLLSARREYLHITIGRFVYDVCAAPYGTGFFVSLWYAEQTSAIKRRMIKKWPGLQEITDRKSYYQIDTEGMAKGLIHEGFNEAVQALTDGKGSRGLSEAERRFF